MAVEIILGASFRMRPALGVGGRALAETPTRPRSMRMRQVGQLW
jgi:hypothetical protein